MTRFWNLQQKKMYRTGSETVSEQAGLAGSALLGIINQIIGLLWIFQILCSTDNGFA